MVPAFGVFVPQLWVLRVIVVAFGLVRAVVLRVKYIFAVLGIEENRVVLLGEGALASASCFVTPYDLVAEILSAEYIVQKHLGVVADVVIQMQKEGAVVAERLVNSAEVGL